MLLTGRDPAQHASRGLRLTATRDLLLRFFQRAGERHWSAEDIYKALMADGEAVGINAVRRTLFELEQAGLLARHSFEGSKTVFERSDRPPHDHLVCLHCGAVEDFRDPAIEERRQAVAALHGFALRHHQLVLYGRCARPGCLGP